VLVVAAEDPDHLIGILTRGDLLAAHARRLRETHAAGRHIRVRQALKRRFGRSPDS
jgi:hypothetical protein